MEKKPNGCLIIIIIIAVLSFITALGGGSESEYEKAGKEFNTWINEDPNTWSDVEKEYLNDLMEWADNN